MRIEEAKREDAAEILAVQKLSFISQAELYNDFSLPPLMETEEKTKDDFDDHLFLKASVEGEIIGSIRASLRGDAVTIKRLVVHPDFQNRGIGTELVTEIEKRFPGATRFRLFTGHKSQKSIHLYEKLGYAIYRTKKESEDLTLVFMEKRAGG
jgi:ribosomal protein S18 acetylase RimI-like enzyme